MNGKISEQEEQMASETHNVWSSWMKYMFSKGEMNPDGTWSMPQWAVNRWSRQLSTPYAELDEQEKQSDRDVITEHYPSVLALKVRAEQAEARVKELEQRLKSAEKFIDDECLAEEYQNEINDGSMWGNGNEN